MGKITANIASIPSREKELIKTIDSVINQVDKVNVCLNNYKHNPYIHPKVNVIFEDNSLGDAGKFMFLDNFDGYYLSCDDDIIYPPTYIIDMIPEIDNYGIVSHHGRSFDSFPIANYYKGANHRVQCLSENLNYGVTQFGGTGVMGFHTDNFNPSFDIFKRANMSDIWIGIEADKQGLTITTLPHSEDYFTYQHIKHTIWNDKNDNCQIETDIINNYFF